MGVLQYTKDLGPRMVGYKLAYHRIIKPPMPSTITHSITNACQSACKSCNIYKYYMDEPDLKADELTLDEVEKVFKSMGRVFFYNISGGEPFLRRDIPELVDKACKHLNPKIIHTPTNALMPQFIEKQTRKIMETINEHNPNIRFTIKPSFDGIGETHDYLRGVKGNYEKLIQTIKRLKALQQEFPNLHVGIGTVISKNNLDTLHETVEVANELGVNTYINEIAEKRQEMFNDQEDITPTADEYEKAMKVFTTKIKKDMPGREDLDKTTQAFRLVYYDLVLKTLRQKRQVVPCYSGVSNAHLNPYGDIWPCSIMAYDKNMGNVRDFNYDFKKLWHSKRANEIRKFIAEKRCYCPMANAAYTSILQDFGTMMKVIKHRLFTTN